MVRYRDRDRGQHRQGRDGGHTNQQLRGFKWRMVFEDNYVGVGDNKALLHDKRWNVYMIEKRSLIRGGYYVEVSCCDGKKVLLEVVDDCVVEKPNDNYEIGLHEVDFNLFYAERGGG